LLFLNKKASDITSVSLYSTDNTTFKVLTAVLLTTQFSGMSCCVDCRATCRHGWTPQITR